MVSVPPLNELVTIRVVVEIQAGWFSLVGKRLYMPVRTTDGDGKGTIIK